ncbi:septum formation inhibitor Maf [bacterium]|nr:septum formation inhibitor Maf [bacterium]
MDKLYLASRSPRRIYLLNQIGIPFEPIGKEEFEEDTQGFFDPVEMVLKHALQKARAVIQKPKNGWILACDTIVFIDGQILGKPHDAENAKSKLRWLSGRWHKVYTGLCLYNHGTGQYLEDYEMTRVKFTPLTDAEIELYVQSGEPMDKAGAYGIQKIGAMFIDRVEGCFYNVVGLPISCLINLMEKAGFKRESILKRQVIS